MSLRHITEEEFAAMIRRKDRDHIELYPVRDYGAAGDGSTDDTAAFARALTAAGTVRGGKPLGEPVAKVGAAPRPAPSPLMLALTGPLPSGKNQVQLLFRHGKVHKYPNKTFTNWRATAHVQLLEQVSRCATRLPTITVPVRLTVEYWPGDARTRDVSGQLDALFHLLVYAKVLKDDGLVHDVTWKRQAMNRKFPKTILTIEAL